MAEVKPTNVKPVGLLVARHLAAPDKPVSAVAVTVQPTAVATADSSARLPTGRSPAVKTKRAVLTVVGPVCTVHVPLSEVTVTVAPDMHTE